MLADDLCAGLPALLDAANAAMPAGRPIGLGVVCAEHAGRALFLYVDALGSTGYIARSGELPAGFQPGSSECVVAPDAFASRPDGLVESRLLHSGLPDEFARPAQAGRIVAQPVVSAVPTQLVVTFPTPGSLSASERESLKAIGTQVQQLVARKESPAEELERLRRLEAADRLLPALFQELDIRQIFDRVSTITKEIIRHDFASVCIFNESLTGLTLFGKTSSLSVQEYSGPMPYPPSQTRAWLCRVVPDLQAHPVDGRVEFSALAGGRTSIRVAVRLDDRAIGALNFSSRDALPYTALDLAIARRVADYVALAISHQRLAEEGRRAAALEERNAKLEVRVQRLTDELDEKTHHRAIGQSRAWREVLRHATKVSPTEATVLLTGESGTGKEVVARLIHHGSPRGVGPFVALNCAALPEALLESELFGHEKGAFTGALTARPGKIEQASGGVLFLDEVGDMSPAVQAKFLRVLQEREYQRLGGSRTLRADVRVLAATNRNLKAATGQGTFREDLYYRLAVFEISLPPLRERVEDILPLVEAFLEDIGRSIGRPAAGISQEVQHTLKAYHWPGNVRELRNAIERAIILCEGGLITSEHLPIGIVSPDSSRGSIPVTSVPPPSPGSLTSVERDMIVQALRRSGDNKSKAARLLGLTRAQLRSRLEKHGI